MKIALPIDANDELVPNYCAAAQFALFEVDAVPGTLQRELRLTPPSRKPCVWPDWLRTQGVNLFLVGGMGAAPLERMRHNGIDVKVGVAGGRAGEIVASLLQGRLCTGENACGTHVTGEKDPNRNRDLRDEDCQCEP